MIAAMLCQPNAQGDEKQARQHEELQVKDGQRSEDRTKDPES